LGTFGKVMPAPQVGSPEFQHALRQIISQSAPLMTNLGSALLSEEDIAHRAEVSLYHHPAVRQDPQAREAIRRAFDVEGRRDTE